jgi:hypothetical protein
MQYARTCGYKRLVISPDFVQKIKLYLTQLTVFIVQAYQHTVPCGGIFFSSASGEAAISQEVCRR